MKVTGKGSGRISIAGLTCYKPGKRGRLIYRTMVHSGRKGEKKGFREPDFAALLDAAHQQLGGPIVLVWDNLHGHVSAAMRVLIAGPQLSCPAPSDNAASSTSRLVNPTVSGGS